MKLSGEWQMASGNEYDASRRVVRAALRNRQFTRHLPLAIRHSSAFTLIELLIVISILAILAALLLGVAARAGERGREARTKAMIARIHTLVMEHYDTYKDRRAPLSSTFDAAKGQARAEARLYALRELMVLEMPDRWSDVILGPVDSTGATGVPLYLKNTSSSQHRGPTPLNEAYRRQYFSMLNAGVAPADIERFQGAECLYMIVMFATADGEARSLFNESSIGDTDGDGSPEFLDGWGRPIDFLRWAPGFESDLQLNARSLGSPTDSPWLEAAAADHDSFDMFRVEPRAFRLVPLIYSAGGDETYAIFNASGNTTWPSSNTPSSPRLGTPILSPYYPYSVSAGGVYIGTPLNEADQVDPTAGADNINNHNIAAE